MSNQQPRMGQALAPFILFAIATSGCADKPVPVRKDQLHALTAQVRAPATIPERLRGVWYVDDTEGRASCRKYLSTDPATIERTGADPLVGSVVISSRIVHHYSEYGEGDFFLVESATEEETRAWTLRGRVSVDSLPGDGEYATQTTEQIVLAGNGAALSFSEDRSRNFFRCGPIRSDLYLSD